VAALAALLQHPGIRRGSALALAIAPGVPTGFAALDPLLPGGGWTQGAVTELWVKTPASGEMFLLSPLLRHVLRQRQWVLLVDPPAVPYAPAWAGQGLDPARVAWCQSPDTDEAAFCMEQALRLPDVGAVVTWQPQSVRAHAPWHRWILAAEQGTACGFVVHFGEFSAERGALQRSTSSPVPLRIGLEPTSEGILLYLLKRRGPPVLQPLLFPWGP
jgi:hypothetical protein